MISGTDGLQEAMAGLGDIYIDLSELERFQATVDGILDTLMLMRTVGIGVGVAGMGLPVTPSPFPGPPRDVPDRPPATPHPGGGGQQQNAQIFNFYPAPGIDAEEVLQQVAQIVSEN